MVRKRCIDTPWVRIRTSIIFFQENSAILKLHKNILQISMYIRAF